MSEADLALYGWALDHPGVDLHRAAADLGLSPERTAGAAARLRGAGLLQATADGSGTEQAVAPDIAAGGRIASLEAAIRQQQAEIARIQLQATRFAPVYQLRTERENHAVEVIPTLKEVRGRLNHMAAQCRGELLTSQPGGGARKPEVLEDALARDRPLLERGVRLRTLYHHAARFHRPSQAYVAAASALGAEYRTQHELFGRVIVFDRETAFLPTAEDSGGAVVIREPHTVAYLCGLFERAWETAEPFADAGGEGFAKVAGELDRTILKLLGAGLKDEAIARRLGISLRTARRHIADIMEGLGADSRFQAGATWAREGLLHDA
ncbi:LuxR C-terminal-related transcriptional regulator [Streptomyces sp. NBC_00249]|uniref:helix-turn-helix transcriptional regulator n=1 Tax=Streptomyces sp. NBC_00249 TaxID=2975690 RepID=UPI00224D0652|nr:LuxR C-terminal-related transcriptional regulator [Streptomyces sp. NBC_00249]MCX5199364.1 LuxR C-terminal-related transcriptional regulator [Streptomyces sp. NBC_00249]